MKSILVSYKEPSIEVFLALWLIRMFGKPAPIGFRYAKVVYYEGVRPPTPSNLREDVLILTPGCLSAKNEKQFFMGLLVSTSVRNVLRTYIMKARNAGIFAHEFTREIVSVQKPAPVLFAEAARFFEGVLGERMRKVITLTEAHHVPELSRRGKEKEERVSSFMK